MITVQRTLRSIAALLACAAMACAHGEEIGGTGLQISGFGTLGAIKQSNPDKLGRFRRDITQRIGMHSALLPDSRLGAQANWAIGSQWELVAQAVASDHPSEAPLADRVKRAYVAYRPSPDVTLRLGRFGADLFMLTDSINVGYGNLLVRPQFEFYGSGALTELDGLDTMVRWTDLGGAWLARAWVGRTVVRYAWGPSVDVRKPSGGFSLSRETGPWVWKAAWNWASARWAGPSQEGLRQQLQSIADLGVPGVSPEAAALARDLRFGGGTFQQAALGVSGQFGLWSLQAELRRCTGTTLPEEQVAYVQVARRVGKVTYYGVAAVSRSPGLRKIPDWYDRLTPSIGATAARNANDSGVNAAYTVNFVRTHEESASLGLRWDLRDNIALKLQWDRMRVHGDGVGLWGTGQTSEGHTDVGTATLDFVF